MARRVADTNIVSFLLKRHTLAARYLPHLQGHTVAISFMTVAELLEWALRARWGRRRLAVLQATLMGYTVVASSADLCRLWAQVRHERRSQPIGIADAWVAATALHLGCELVTHNPTDFQGITGLTIITEVP